MMAFFCGSTVMEQQTSFGQRKASIDDPQTKFGSLRHLAALTIQLERRHGGQSFLAM